jgi:hypothetical protein
VITAHFLRGMGVFNLEPSVPTAERGSARSNVPFEFVSTDCERNVNKLGTRNRT